MAEHKTPSEVVAQAQDNSVWNTDPALVKGTVVGLVTAVGSILVIGGYIDETQKQALADNAGVIVPAVLGIAAVVQAVWTRRSVWAPRTAAQAAVVSAKTGVPTLIPPP